jgi:ATP-dependent DNA helicase DinG
MRALTEDPFEEVDLPYMLLRLRQGMGRLIRNSEDQGIVVILGEQLHGDPHVMEKVKEVLPKGVSLAPNLVHDV